MDASIALARGFMARGISVRGVGGFSASGADERDCAAHRVYPRILIVDTEVVEEGQDLDREGLVDLEQVDIRDGKSGTVQSFLGTRHRADTHDLWLDPGEGEPNHAHLRGEAEFGGDFRPGEQRCGCSIGET
jgi:hypothetical protein